MSQLLGFVRRTSGADAGQHPFLTDSIGGSYANVSTTSPSTVGWSLFHSGCGTLTYSQVTPVSRVAFSHQMHRRPILVRDVDVLPALGLDQEVVCRPRSTATKSGS